MPVVLAALLVLALAALAGAALRCARRLGAEGLEVPLAAAPFGAALAAGSALALGLAGLGGSPVALTAAALAAYAAARAWDPAPVAPALWRALGDWWADRSRGERLAVGALAGAAAAWTAWVLRHPGLAIDPLSYHLPESIMWVQQGTPGSVEVLQYDFPQGEYPLTNEVLVAWQMGIARSNAPALLWTPATALLAVLAGWLGLRRLAADRLAGGLGIAAVLLTPVAASQLIGPHTDLPALAWLWVAAALVAAAERRPRLLAAAVLAAGLAVGTKTTAAPLAALLVAVAIVRHGRLLARRPAPVAAAALLAVAVGGVWYLRNLVRHGSPLYPFKALPFGDPVPAFLQELDVAFLERPAATLARNGDAYLQGVAGGLVVLALGLLVPLAARRRGALLAAGVAALALLTWLTAPFTGAARDPVLDVSATTTRYLLPALSAAALAVALAGRLPLVAAALAAACAWSLLETQDLPLLAMPGTGTLLAGAAAGALLARAGRAPARRPAGALLAGGLVAVLAVGGDGFARRQADAGFLRSADLVAWAATHPAWQAGAFPIAFAPQIVSPLAGDELQHSIELVGRTESCAAIAERARRGWVVLGTLPAAERRAPFSAAACLERVPPGTQVLYGDAAFTVFGPA